MTIHVNQTKMWSARYTGYLDNVNIIWQKSFPIQIVYRYTFDFDAFAAITE